MIGKANVKTIKHLLSYVGLCFPILLFGQLPTAERVIKTSYFKHRCVKTNSNINLKEQLPEGSGMVAWNGKIWTHNDSGLPRIFALDSINGKILKSYDLPGVKNVDWEDMSQDNTFIYVGDIGNNSGARERLKIYRIRKEALLNDKMVFDSIFFEWPLINDSGKLQKINFDCEAMAVIHDTIFLFTKEWKKRRCSRIFKIPAAAGNHIAEYVATIKTRLLITAASYSEEKKRIVLCGYSLFLTPGLLVLPLPDSGNLKDINTGTKVRIANRLRQTEGIASFNGNNYYVISEGTNLLFWKNKPKLFCVTID